MNELTPDRVKAEGFPLRLGNLNASTKILIVSSCRGIPHVDYLLRFTTEPMEVTVINPHNYGLVGRDEDFIKYENDPRFLEAFERATIFIYEPHYRYALFNTSKRSCKNIWQFGLQPKMTIEIPAFHNHFILALSQWRFIPEFSCDSYRWVSMKHIARFLEHCSRSSLAGLDQWFMERWTKERLFWSDNHITKRLSLEIFRRIIAILGFKLRPGWDREAESYNDIYKYDPTPITALDVNTHNLEWHEPCVDIPNEPHVMSPAEIAHAAL